MYPVEDLLCSEGDRQKCSFSGYGIRRISVLDESRHYRSPGHKESLEAYLCLAQLTVLKKELYPLAEGRVLLKAAIFGTWMSLGTKPLLCVPFLLLNPLYLSDIYTEIFSFGCLLVLSGT